ncbi:DUF2779 domain-containing protein [Lacibacter sediminis]|uniref:DUF2779 domain-containing protein n=1 Tax=Lacibacter sediminis TaxID=2760713 RepID=A0A7G5XFQ4_9BACT|nr:DUF2779 domain-containing protein [Lacibacter sediminis]QNA44307.1 DUF2779 domain-containing protein [Lacibacter sediminis]
MHLPESKRHLLSKSTCMMGIQCPKRLWYYRKRPDLRPEISAAQQMVFQKGTDVGQLAQQLFPEGKDATPIDSYHYAESIRQTYEWIEAGEKIIYEATFQYDRVMAAIDILVCKKGKWTAYEVKSTTEVKDQHIKDAALQYYVISNAGLTLSDIYIVHLNTEYVRQGELDVTQLFNTVSIKKEVLALQNEVENWIAENKRVLELKVEPSKDIGTHCFDPYECEYMEHCWSHVPEVSVFNLSRMKAMKKFELYYQGILEFHQLPNGYRLTSSQRLQVETYLKDYIQIETNELRNWVQQLKYPLVFMDFETFMPAVPLYNNSQPYQHVPFQFSVHVQEVPDTQLKHYEFLGKPEADPRKEFINQLIAATKGKGHIVVYNKAFESSRLKELQDLFPEHKTDIDKMLKRIIDLMEPFQKKWYYSPSMNGSYSIKSVLPALVPELSYKELEIGEGGSAMAAYEGLLNIDGAAEKKRIRESLLEYCKLDTLAMVKILEKLAEV